MPSDRECMQKAVDQARLSRAEPGRISPKVGAVVISKTGEFVGEAHRGEDQDHKDHAEFYALEKKLRSQIVANGTVFTTLEPCFEFYTGPQDCICSTGDKGNARQVI